MPRRAKTSTKVTSKKVKRTRRRNRVRKNRPLAKVTGMSMNKAYRDYAEMVVDPCMGPLVRAPGISDGVNVVERQRVSLSLNKLGRAQGYIIWFPAWQGAGTFPTVSGANQPQNCFLYEAPDTVLGPTNTAGFPMGSGAFSPPLHQDCGYWIHDPSWAQVSSGTFSRSRATAACLQLEYLGALSAAAGQVCMVSNFSYNALISYSSGSASGALTFPSVDAIFSYAATRERLDLNGHEVIFRPSDLDCKLRGASEELAGQTHLHGTTPDGLFWGGNPGATASVGGAPDPREAVGICIAWRSMPTVANTLTANLIKVSEYETAPLLNLVEQPHNPKQTTPGLTISAVVDKLTAMLPKWQVSTVIKNAESMYRMTTALRAATAGRRNAGEALRGMRMISDGEL